LIDPITAPAFYRPSSATINAICSKSVALPLIYELNCLFHNGLALYAYIFTFRTDSEQKWDYSSLAGRPAKCYLIVHH
jgi:hypothetical protein